MPVLRDVALAAAITRRASHQSYLTIRWLADPTYRVDAFALYAYFRWLDDRVDEDLPDEAARIAFVARQRELLAAAAHGDGLGPLAPQEAFLVHLVGPARGQWEARAGAVRSVAGMLDVMDFDARRRGRAVTQEQLDAYTDDLAVAVTEALHHCIGHGEGCPPREVRYVAVAGAHVAHMLRDLVEDLEAGYVNVPAGLLPDPPTLADVHAPAMREWVADRVALARSRFDVGRRALAQVENARCRLAGHAYVARFEWVLDAIERDGFRLRPGYPERSTLRGGLRIAVDGARSAVAGAGERRAAVRLAHQVRT
jgi:phytoene/squalene synthetase